MPRIAAKIPWDTRLLSRVQRLWRWLKNPRLDPFLLSQAVAERWLKNFADQTIYLVIDRTDIKDKHWLLFVGLAYRGRTFPLVWDVLPGKGSTSFRQQVALLRAIVPKIDDSCTVVLRGDREFRSTALMNFCKRRNWHFRLRLKCDTWIRANRHCFQLKQLDLQPGERRYFQNVYITKILFEFKKRFYVEPMFWDFKSRGFDIERTSIQKPLRISRMLLVVVTAYLFLTNQGLRCIRSGRRRYFEKSRRRFYSLFRLGALDFSDRFDRGSRIFFTLPRLC